MLQKEVLVTLRADVDRTSMEYDERKQIFWRIGADTRSSHDSVVSAANAQNQAMIAYATAIRRLNEFLLTGKVPEDLQILTRGVSRSTTSAVLAAHA